MSYSQLLDVFWKSHNSASKVFSRQYRNAIFYMSEEQRLEAEQSRDRLEQTTKRPVYTAIDPGTDFYPAENYHQKYYLRSVDRLITEFKRMYPDENQFAASTAAAKINGYLGCYGQPDNLKSEINLFGLSQGAQQYLIEQVSTKCGRFKGVGCVLSQQ